MIVCQCTGVTDRKVRGLVREGATSLEEVAVACAIGEDCGGCLETVRAILLEEVCFVGRALATSVSTSSGRPPAPLEFHEARE
jgi:bacterioferritin-associated ferredoxin